MSTKPLSKVGAFGVVAAVLMGIVVALVLLVGVAIQMGHLPDSAARPAGKIPAGQLRQLQEMGVTRPGERVLFFYSAAIVSIRGDGNLFTNERVISYQESEGSLEIWEAAYDEIADIEFEPSGTWLEDSIITVTKHDEDWFVLYVSNESQGDKLFYRKLMEEWNKHGNAGKELGEGEAASP